MRVKGNSLLIVACLLLGISFAKADDVIRFAPLPMASLEQLGPEYVPFLDYLERQTGKPFELVYYASYKDVLNAFMSGDVHLAYLGPLPYLALTEQTQSAQPVVQLLDSDGNASYTCALAHFAADPFDASHSDQLPKRIALTQPLSTCGYLQTEAYLQERGYSLEDAFHTYTYTGSHEQVALSVILGQSDLGALKTKIADRYTHLGLRVIDETPPLPGFILVANTDRLDQHIINTIRTSLIGLDPLENQQDADLTQGWSQNLRYGAIEVDEQAYDLIRQQWQDVKTDLIGAEQ